MNQRSLWRIKVESGIDDLIAEVNRASKLEGVEHVRKRDVRFRDGLVAVLESIIRCRKASELYEDSGLGKVGYRISMHVDSDRMVQRFANCECAEQH